MKRLLTMLAAAALLAACSSDTARVVGPEPGGGAADAGGGVTTDAGVAPDAVGETDTAIPPDPDTGGGEDTTVEPDVTDPPDDTGVNPHDTGVDPEPEPEADPGERSRRRMDVVQLDRSIRVVTGGIGWTDVAGEDGPSLFDALASTLGVPDFIDRTREDLSPSLLFHKFMSDASRSVCTAWIEQESDIRTAEGTFFAPGVAADATLETDLTGVFETVQRLLLRAHGHRYALDDPQLQPWANAFDEVVDATGEPWRGWRAVCIAALMHPDFYSY